MTINQIIYNLRKLIKDAGSDDLKFSDRQLEFMVNYVRAKLIKQEIDKGKSISDNVKQDLGVVKLAKVDSAESSTVPISRIILRTENRIPKVLELNHKDAITYVGGIDKLSPFQFSTKAHVNWQAHSKYASKGKHAYLRDGYIALAGCDKSTKYINIEGVFENPRDVKHFMSPTGQSCYNPDVDNYPVSSYMIDAINKIIIREELGVYFQLREDNINDASSEVKK